MGGLAVGDRFYIIEDLQAGAQQTSSRDVLEGFPARVKELA